MYICIYIYVCIICHRRELTLVHKTKLLVVQVQDPGVVERLPLIAHAW